ncbi:helix-turn-helix domain-containing protein [Lactobacillus helveticus]|uniref:helix-turn-helix domain-containing protein n=1 Tax=Lactobacillus helveticus TaxID=1587 RepID=UPI0038BD4CEF
MSRGYLNNIFVKNMGITPANYLLKLRMEKAKIDFSSTTKMIKEIAKDVGYTDQYTFSKAFKRYTGFSPMNYQKNLL